MQAEEFMENQEQKEDYQYTDQEAYDEEPTVKKIMRNIKTKSLMSRKTTEDLRMKQEGEQEEEQEEPRYTLTS